LAAAPIADLCRQGAGGIQAVGQDLVIRDNPALTSLADLPMSLKSVGAFRGGDVFIEGNPQLQVRTLFAQQQHQYLMTFLTGQQILNYGIDARA
jgi:hypothetical protein